MVANGVGEEFAADSPLEEAGFEPSVPLRNQGTLSGYTPSLFDPTIATHNGRLVKTAAGGFDGARRQIRVARAADMLGREPRPGRRSSPLFHGCGAG
jgi:hypothetical protein